MWNFDGFLFTPEQTVENQWDRRWSETPGRSCDVIVMHQAVSAMNKG